MSGRPRIRSLKPEMWADEKIGDLSRDARLLFVGLVTMADDEGRLRAAFSLILGHAYPYDQDAARRLPAWLAELEAAALILRYQDGGKPYIAFRHWRRHQKINKATGSLLPAPPDPGVVRENAVPEKGAGTEDSGSAPGGGTEEARPPARARPGGSDRIGSDHGSEEPPQPPTASGGGSSQLPRGSRGNGTNPRALAVAAKRVVLLAPADEDGQRMEKLHTGLRSAMADEGQYEMWLAPLEAFGRDGDVLVLDIPDTLRGRVESGGLRRALDASAERAGFAVRLRTDNDVIEQEAA